ncbi:unnamed protein product [Cuscuta campestris]|uniref:CCHC-type domain-containing protein n=1 Tax=Cuscuta campestris TaxID=132261 RepID=A0A484NEE3_9ASTE|nr:unnamed protein product [Cuscuta campestris]
MQLNARAINFLYCAVNPDDYRKISRCKTANEMWNKLEVTYEGTSQVKDSKIDLLTHEYEVFMMMENETIDGMFERFSTIISNLDTLGKHYEDHVLVRKILRSLTSEWKSTVNPIKEGRDYNTLTYDALRGKLLTYEMSNFSSAAEIKREQNLSFKGVALKASSSKYVETSGSRESDILELFNDFLQNELEQLNESTKPTCYGRGERGHIKGHCPNRKFKKSKCQKQSNSSSSSSSDDEVAICLMAQSESEEITPPWSAPRPLPSFRIRSWSVDCNAHKYVASYILRCCALDRTPTLDEFLILFSIGGSFPFYSLYSHSHAPIFERVEFKNDKWSQRYFVIEFPAHSPLDLPGVVLRSSISWTKFATAHSAEEVYNVLRDKGGLIPHHSLQDARLYQKADFYYPLGPDPVPFEGEPSPERSKAPPAVESGPAGSSSGVQTLGDFTALAIRKPTAALEAVPISAIPGLRRPTPSQKRPREGVTDDDFLPKKSKGDGTPALPRPLSTSLVEEEVEGRKEPEIPSATEKEVDVQTEPETPPSKENEVEEQRDMGAPPEMEREPKKQSEPEGQCSTATPPALNVPIRRKFTPQTYPAFQEGWAGFSRGLISMQASHWTIQANLEKMKESLKEPTIPQACPDLLSLNALYSMEQAQQSLLTLTEEYLGGASGNYQAVVALKEKELAARALQQKVGSLEQQVQALQEENARLKENGSMELVAERLRAQISILESKASASEDKVGSLKAELVERESRISELESSLQEAKHEGFRLNELAVKHMEARRLTLEKLGKERQTASKLRLRMGELEKAIASHQKEVATLTARAEALYEEGKFDMQHCIYEAVRSGLPAH